MYTQIRLMGCFLEITLTLGIRRNECWIARYHPFFESENCFDDSRYTSRALRMSNIALNLGKSKRVTEGTFNSGINPVLSGNLKR